MTEEKPQTPWRNLADRMKEKVAEREAEEATKVTGNLAIPSSQKVGESVIVWKWEFGGTFTVLALLALKDDPDYNLETGEYIVQLASREEVGDCISLPLVLAKSLADTLLSACYWSDVWKQYFADLMLTELGKE